MRSSQLMQVPVCYNNRVITVSIDFEIVFINKWSQGALSLINMGGGAPRGAKYMLLCGHFLGQYFA